MLGLGVGSVAWAETTNQSPAAASSPQPDPASVPDRASANESRYLRQQIATGTARLAQVRRALTINDKAELANTIHALYAMRWHRGVHQVLEALWSLDEQGRRDYPELAWDSIAETAVRLAVASTLNRIHPADSEYREYIRAHRYDEHEFHRAQVVIALGLNADPDDVEYIVSQIQGDNDYVIQSAITALGLMENEKAYQALKELEQQYRDEPRGRLIQNVIRYAYPRTEQHS